MPMRTKAAPTRRLRARRKGVTRPSARGERSRPAEPSFACPSISVSVSGPRFRGGRCPRTAAIHLETRALAKLVVSGDPGDRRKLKRICRPRIRESGFDARLPGRSARAELVPCSQGRAPRDGRRVSTGWTGADVRSRRSVHGSMRVTGERESSSISPGPRAHGSSSASRHSARVRVFEPRLEQAAQVRHDSRRASRSC